MLTNKYSTEFNQISLTTAFRHGKLQLDRSIGKQIKEGFGNIQYQKSSLNLKFK